MKVYTNIKVLKQVKRLINDMDLGFLLDGNKVTETSVIDVINELLDNNKLVEFLQIVTRNNEVDFEEMASEEVAEIVNNFFVGIGNFVPDFLKKQITGKLGQKTFS